jgi:glycosyltransferase involved in cell wall biosynthesis
MRQRPLKKHLYLALVGKRYIRSAAAVHFTSLREREEALRVLSIPSAGQVIPNALDLSSIIDRRRARLARDEPQDPPRILFLSRIHPKKQPDVLLRAVALLRRMWTQPIRVDIAGAGDADYVAAIERLAHELGLDDVLTFHGFVLGQTKLNLLLEADIFVLPTLQENFGNAIYEAMAAGCAVVTSAGLDGYEELLEAGAARIPSDNSPESLARVLYELITNVDERRLVQSAATTWTEARFCPESLTRAYLDMYNDAIAQPL